MKPHWDAWKMWKSCSRKKKYAHEGQARRAAHEQNQRAYRCKYCDGPPYDKQSR